MRPDQPRFDHFSHHFEQLDNRLEEFGNEYGWELIKNPLRMPSREMRHRTDVNILFSIQLEGHWLKLDPEAPFLHRIACCAIYQPVSDLRFFKEQVITEHQPFDYVKENLDYLLPIALKFASECKLPTLTTNGFYLIPEGWCAGTDGSLLQWAELNGPLVSG